MSLSLFRRVLLCLLASTLLPIANAQVAVTTYHDDNARTGQNTQEQILTPSNVNSSSFGKVASFSIQPSNGGHAYVYAEPLFVPNVNIGGTLHNVVYVVTEADQVFAFDADNVKGGPLWSKTYDTPFTPGSHPSNYLADTIGIQSTPVIDTSTGTMYFVSNSQSGSTYLQKLHAVNITNGTEKFGGPVVIQGSAPGNADGGSTVTFNAATQNQRPALLLANGTVYIAWGSYDDSTAFGVYHGWVMAYNAATLGKVATFNSTPNGHEGSLWALGALAADSSSPPNIYVGAANGDPQNNTEDSDIGNSNYAEAYLKLSGSTLGVLDWFMPSDWSTLTSDDQDANGGGAIVLPDEAGSSTHPHLLVWGSKGGKIYLSDRDDMGMLFNSDSHLVQSFQAWDPASCAGDDGSCVRTLPAYWNGKVYFIAQNHGLQIYSLNNGLLSTTPTQDTTAIYPMRGATPSISANGSLNGIVWAAKVDPDPTGGANKPSALYAYDATTAKVLYNSNQNASRDALDIAQNFTVPLVVNGKVYVATRDRLVVYGLLNGDTPPFGYLEQAINATNGSTTLPQNSTLLVTGWACDKEDGSPVTKVQILIDGAVVGNATLGGSRPDLGGNCANAGWTFSYNIGNLSPGAHTVTAVAYDSAGATTTLNRLGSAGAITVDTAPFGYLEEAINATNGSTTLPQNSTLLVTGWACDKEDGSPVTKVQILIDGAVVGNATLGGSRPDLGGNCANAGWTFSYNIGNLSPGAHTVTAVAYDSAGATTTLNRLGSAGAITVDTAPFGYLEEAINATNGSTTLPQNSTLLVTGWACDKEDGSPVTKVQILIDGAVVGNATLGGSRPDLGGNCANAGWTFSYNIGNLASGSHTVTAVAYDSQSVTTQLTNYNGAGTITVTSGGSVASIAHVFFMLQENHSFDNYFGRMGQYRANKGFTDSFDGVPLSASYSDANGNAVSPYHLATVCTEDLAPGWDPSHLAVDGGAMDRFPLETQNYLPSSIDSGGRRSMGYYDQRDLPYYYELAFQFGTSDRYFSSVLTRTIPNRMYMFAATSFGHINNDSPPGGGWTQATIFDRLDAAGVKWRVYRVDETNSLADWSIYSRDSSKVFPISQYFTDVKSESTTPQVVFIDRGGGSAGADEHPGSDIQTGASEVAKIINALLVSPSWHSSAFFLSWDEPGGFYDHVPPAGLTKPDNIAPMLCCGEPSGDFAHSGLRVPVVVVSPWIKPHFVSHVVRDHTSILKFIETRFNLQPLTARDANADNMLEFFDFSTPHLATPPSLPSQPTNGNCDAGAETTNS